MAQRKYALPDWWPKAPSLTLVVECAVCSRQVSLSQWENGRHQALAWHKAWSEARREIGDRVQLVNDYDASPSGATERHVFNRLHEDVCSMLSCLHRYANNSAFAPREDAESEYCTHAFLVRGDVGQVQQTAHDLVVASAEYIHVPSRQKRSRPVAYGWGLYVTPELKRHVEHWCSVAAYAVTEYVKTNNSPSLEASVIALGLNPYAHLRAVMMPEYTRPVEEVRVPVLVRQSAPVFKSFRFKLG